MTPLFPGNNLERSPLHSLHAHAVITTLGAKPFVERYFDDRQRPDRPCGLIDLANLHRVGFRGAQAAEYLAGQQYSLPDAPNTAVRQANGEWIARLSLNEYFLLGALRDGGERLAHLEANSPNEQHGCYCLPRQDSHTCLALYGEHISEVMAKLCGVDLRPRAFACGAVVQTSVARVNGIIVNATIGATPCFFLLFDRASAHYLWHALLDALEEFGGAAAGINQLPPEVR